MLLTIQPEQAEQIIPDANSAKAAKKLAKFKDWNNIAGSEDQWVWGEITGSAIYQSAIFLPELKCECSCPSFKRPCKHALALLLVYVENKDQFSIQTDQALIPERVQKWRDKKAKVLDKKEKVADKPIDEEARAKRQASREKKMQEGMEALQTWLIDIANLGLARLRQHNDSIKQMAGRLVDAQAAGVNVFLDELSSALYQEDWQQRSQFWLAKLQVTVSLWQNRYQLPDGLNQELKQFLGINLPNDVWDHIPNQNLTVYALGQVTESLNQRNGRYRRQWLWDSEELQDYLQLDFEIPPYTSFEVTLPYQKIIPLAVKFYPAARPHRVRIGDFSTVNQNVVDKISPKGLSGFDVLYTRYAEGLKANPLQGIRFFWLNDLRLIKQDTTVYLVDQQHQMIALDSRQLNYTELWFTVAYEPFDAGLEWDGLNMRLISIAQRGYFECLSN